MKIIRMILFMFCLPVMTALAQTIEGSSIDVNQTSVAVIDEHQLAVAMDITLPEDLKLTSNRMLTLTPYLRSKEDNVKKVLSPILCYGRKRLIVAKRSHRIPKDAFTVIRRKNGTRQSVNYATRIELEPWMTQSELLLWTQEEGCSNCHKGEDEALLAEVNLVPYELVPLVAFIQPKVDVVKERTEGGRAYLDFQISQTTINPEYRRNPQELEKIKSMMDAVCKGNNTTIKGITITGYASPEGAYEQNVVLAQNRAMALRNYLLQLYPLEPSLFTVKSVPEDWEGLRAYVATCNLPQREELLDIIDSDESNLDAKEWRIKLIDNREPYTQLLNDCYPTLRHSDYAIDYTVRGFTAEEASQLIATRPQLLSLQEMYAVAQTYEEGSEKYDEAFAVAVRLYPEDPIANCNAAAIALRKGNLTDAEIYLKKSDPTDAGTLNNQGVLALLKHDYAGAETYLQQAAASGSKEATENLDRLIKKRSDDQKFGKHS